MYMLLYCMYMLLHCMYLLLYCMVAMVQPSTPSPPPSPPPRELNLIPKLTSLLKPTLAAAAADKLTRQQQLNLLTALMLTQILMAPLVDAPEGPQEGPGTTQRQNVDAVQGVLLKQGLLEPLTITGISKATQGPIRAAVCVLWGKLGVVVWWWYGCVDDGAV